MIIDRRRKAHPNVPSCRRSALYFPASDFGFSIRTLPSADKSLRCISYISSYDENDNDDAPGLMTKSDEVDIPRWIRIMETFSVIRPP